jgi:hypothetical protein
MRSTIVAGGIPSYHGRPALIGKTHRDIAKRLRALAAKGVDIPRVKRVDYL